MKKQLKEILDKNEKVIWDSGINLKVNLKKMLFFITLFSLLVTFVIFIIIFQIFKAPNYNNSTLVLIVVTLIVLITTMFISYKLVGKRIKNTHFFITNKKIIKRTGLFKDKYVFYNIKYVNSIVINQNLFDVKSSENGIGSLFIKIKNTNLSLDDKAKPFLNMRLYSLEKVHEAYKILFDLIKVYNKKFKTVMGNDL